MKFSSRTSFGISAPNALTLLLEKKKAARLPVLDLTASNPTQCGLRLEGLLEVATDLKNLLYEPDPRGLLSARQAVCAYYEEKKIRVHPEDVFLTSGTSEAYSFLFHLLCEPGEEILCQSPTYPLMDHLAAFAGIEARCYPRLPVAAGKSKALVLVNPANPTGRYVDETNWDSVDLFCSRQGLAVISDEVFFDFDWQRRARVSGASRREGLHFTLSGVSKVLGLPQMKLAWIILSGPEDQKREAAARLETIADAFLSVNTPAQNALPVWLKRKDEFVDKVIQRVGSNFKTLRSFVVGAEEPQGGWYALVPLPEGASDEAVSLRLLEEWNVLVHPGYFFDLEKERLVVSLLPESALFAEGAASLGSILK